MKIGELSRRTGVAPRLLRYYEQQGIVQAARSDNGYRNYTEEDVARVQRVALLVRSGVPTRLVRAILDLEGPEAAELAGTCTAEAARTLAAELQELDARIGCLQRSRETIRGFLARAGHGAVLPPSLAGDEADRQDGSRGDALGSAV
ncbi:MULTISPECIES: MerR family transcriptional regulator [unclassified Blastococcus]